MYFPFSAWMAKKIRYPAADDLFRVSLEFSSKNYEMKSLADSNTRQGFLLYPSAALNKFRYFAK